MDDHSLHHELRTVLMPPAAEYRRLRAPEEDGGRLLVPAWASMPEHALANRASLEAADVQLLGRPLVHLATSARQALLRAATRFTAQYRQPPDGVVPLGIESPPARLVMAGHQPQLFHPGVWYKNFALAQLAGRVDAVAVNLVIDSDLCRTASIAVPAGSPQAPLRSEVPLDDTAAEVPYEQRPVVNREIFANFANRVVANLAELVSDPVVTTLWPRTVVREHATGNLGLAIAQGRHLLESEWMESVGMQPSLEVPQSWVCQLSEFRWFVLHILTELTRFRQIHNRALADYRRAHRLRSPAHPVPDLHDDGQWQEAPFWVWSDADPRRRRLYVCRQGRELLLTDRDQFSQSLWAVDDRDPHDAVAQLAELEALGIKLRSRALTTTMFARLVLCDFFVHGIGGGKYDETTDHILREFFGLQAPTFGIVSATLRLPVAPPAAAAKPARLRQDLRDLQYNPDRWLARADLPASQVSTAEAWREEKQRWIATPQTAANARARHQAIAAANAALAPLVAHRAQALRAQLAGAIETQQGTYLLGSRDYAFCLYPMERLQRLLLDSWQSAP